MPATLLWQGAETQTKGCVSSRHMHQCQNFILLQPARGGLGWEESGSLPVLLQRTLRCKSQEAEKFEKFMETCGSALPSAWKASFHTSYGFFATLWLVQGCFLDDQNAQILVTNCPIWRKTKSSVQLERERKKSCIGDEDKMNFPPTPFPFSFCTLKKYS